MSYEDRDRYGMYKETRGSGPGPALMGADTLIGDSVVNGAEDDLGEIKEIMLDMQTGQVAYAVLAFGGFLGLGEKLFAVPWQALHLDTVNKRMVLDVDKDRLKTAPGFDKDAWPDMSNVNWATGIHSFYGTDIDRPGAPTMGPAASMRGLVEGAGVRSAMGSGMGSSMGAGSAGGPGTGAGSSIGSGAGSGVGAGTGSTGGSTGGGMGPGAGGGGSNLGGSAGAGTDHGDSYGVGASPDPRPGHEGSDKDISRIRGSNIG